MCLSKLTILPRLPAQDVALSFQHIQSEIIDNAGVVPLKLTDIKDSLEAQHVAFSAVCIEFV